MIPGVGWSELLLIAAIAIVVVGPKDLPMLMRNLGRFIGKARAIAREFQDSFEDMARDAELEELRKQAAEIKRQTSLSEPLAAGGPVAVQNPTPKAEPLSPEDETRLMQSHNASILDAERKTSLDPQADEVSAPEPAAPRREGARP